MNKQITLSTFSDELANVRTKKEVIDSRAFSEFCGVDSSNQVPDGDTLGRFRHILEENGIQQKLFGEVVQSLMEKGLILKKGTIVDSTIIEALLPPKIRRRNGILSGRNLFAPKPRSNAANTKSHLSGQRWSMYLES